MKPVMSVTWSSIVLGPAASDRVDEIASVWHATALLTHAEHAIADDHATAWLAVVPGNARARRFYERCGWSDVGAYDNPAGTDGGVVLVPTRRYEKRVRAETSDRRRPTPGTSDDPQR